MSYQFYTEAETSADFCDRNGYDQESWGMEAEAEWRDAQEKEAIALSAGPWSPRHTDLLTGWVSESYLPHPETIVNLVKASQGAVLSSWANGSYTVYYKGRTWHLNDGLAEETTRCYYPFVWNDVECLRLIDFTTSGSEWVSDLLYKNESGILGEFVVSIGETRLKCWATESD